MKLGNIQAHLRKLQLDIIENGNTNNNHLNSRGLHLNCKGMLQYAKNLIEGIRKLRYEKELLRQKKVSLKLCDQNSRISPSYFLHNNTIFQPNVNSINSFNANFKNSEKALLNHNLDTEELINLRKFYNNNPIIGYLNINSLINKTTQLREACMNAQLTCYVYMKLNLMLLSQMPKFTLKVISIPPLPRFRRDLDKNGSKYTTCLESTISKKKWCITFAYKPPYNSNKDGFFKELNKSQCNITGQYENVLVVGDFNIDILDKKKDSKNYLPDLCVTFLLSNLIPEVTCVKPSVDLMVTNRPRRFHNTSLIETGLSDCHKLVLSLFRAFFKRIAAETIECRNYSKFSPEAFLHELDQELNKGIIYNSRDK